MIPAPRSEYVETTADYPLFDKNIYAYEESLCNHSYIF